jgi:hypothetical protein
MKQKPAVFRRGDGDHMNVKQGITMMLLGLAGGVLGALLLFQLNHRAIKAEQFVLVDRKGQMHAILGLTSLGEPSLGFWDQEGKNRIILGFIREGVPGLGLNDEKGNRRANLELAEDGRPGLVLMDEDGERVLSTP